MKRNQSKDTPAFESGPRPSSSHSPHSRNLWLGLPRSNSLASPISLCPPPPFPQANQVADKQRPAFSRRTTKRLKCSRAGTCGVRKGDGQRGKLLVVTSPLIPSLRTRFQTRHGTFREALCRSFLQMGMQHVTDDVRTSSLLHSD